MIAHCPCGGLRVDHDQLTWICYCPTCNGEEKKRHRYEEEAA